MSWFKDGLKDVWDAFLGRDIGNTGSGFGGSGSSRSNTVDQLNLPGSANADDPEEIRQLTASVTDTRDPNASIPVIYGSATEFDLIPASGRETGPTLAYISTSGTNNEFLHMTWWMCHGPIQGLDAFDTNYGNDVVFNRHPDTGSLFSWRFDVNSSTQYYEQTVYDGYGQIFVHSGETSNTARPSWHPDENFYPGIAHIKITLQLPTSGVVDPPFTNLPQLTWFVYGIQPAWRLTNSLENSNVKNRRAAYLYDYLTNKAYGAGISTTDLDLGSFVDVFNVESYNPSFQVEVDGENVLTSNYQQHNVLYLSADKSVGQNVTQQLAEMQCVLTFKRGKFYLKPNDNMLVASNNWYSGASYTFPGITQFVLTEENCLGGVVYTPVPAEQSVNRMTFKSTEHRHIVAVDDDSITFLPRDRTIVFTPPELDPRADNNTVPDFSYSGDASTAQYLGAAHSYLLKSSLSFKATGDFLNADPYDIVRVDHPSFRGLFWHNFIITDVRLNNDMTVDIQATGSKRTDSAARSLDRDTFIALEEDSQDLRKYIYDYAEGLPPQGGKFQFHNQEISAYNENRFDDSYVSGVIIDPETGGSFQEGQLFSVTPRNPQSAIHPYYDHTNTDSVISQRFMVNVAPIYDGQYNIYIRAYTRDPVTQQLTPIQVGNFNDQFRSVPSNNRMPEITTYQGTGLLPDQNDQYFEFTLTLLENTEYFIRVESYENATSTLINTIDLETFTTYADASALPSNLFSFWAGTLDSAYGSNSYSYTGGTLSSVLADCLGGTLTINYDLYYDQAGSYPRSFTVDIPSTNVADALAKTFFYEFANSDWTNIDPQPSYDIKFSMEFRDSGNTLIHTESNLFWLFWGNTKLERAANFSKGSTYNLSEAIQTALVEAGRTDLLW